VSGPSLVEKMKQRHVSMRNTEAINEQVYFHYFICGCGLHTSLK
jgi:CDGSH-type Zn-finger protein